MENGKMNAFLALCVMLACVGGLTGDPARKGKSRSNNRKLFDTRIADRLKQHGCRVTPDLTQIDCGTINLTNWSITLPSQLRRIYAHYASLKNLNNWSFKRLSLLYRVKLDGNPLGPSLIHPQSPFIGCASLAKLSLRKCGITVIHPDFFKGLSALKDLYLARNELQRIGAAWNLPSGLKVLDLYYNSVKEVTRSWNLYRYNLTELYLANNKISSIEEGSIAYGSLKKITLSSNKLKTLPVNLQMYLASNIHENNMNYLNNNPWECDCHLMHLMVRVRDVQDKKFRCANAGGKPLLNSTLLDSINLKCREAGPTEPPTTSISTDVTPDAAVSNRDLTVVQLLRKKQDILAAKRVSADQFHNLSRSLINVDWEIARKVELLAKKRYEG